MGRVNGWQGDLQIAKAVPGREGDGGLRWLLLVAIHCDGAEADSGELSQLLGPVGQPIANDHGGCCRGHSDEGHVVGPGESGGEQGSVKKHCREHLERADGEKAVMRICRPKDEADGILAESEC